MPRVHRRLERKRKAIPGQGRAAAQRVGVSLGTSDVVRSPMPGSTSLRYSFTGISSRLQDSITDRIAATLGPALALPTCSQFLRPSATGRMEFSARLFDRSTCPYSKQRLSLNHMLSV